MNYFSTTGSLKRDYTSPKSIKVNFCFFISLHTFFLALLNTEVKKFICLTFLQLPWSFPQLFLEFYSQKTLYSRALQHIFVQLTHPYRALIGWSRINLPRMFKGHACRLATQAVIYKMATTCLSNCVSGSVKKTSFFSKY